MFYVDEEEDWVHDEDEVEEDVADTDESQTIVPRETRKSLPGGRW